MARATAIFVLAATASCYGTPRSSYPDGGLGGGEAGQAGTGGPGGTGVAGGGGGGGTAGSGAVFVGGPCVVNTGPPKVEVFARASDGNIYRRAYNGSNWGAWNHLAALDGTMIDARSDLDCVASADTIHIVAAGRNPAGALLHASGFGTTYNQFARELSPLIAAQSPSIALSGDGYYLAWSGPGEGPALFNVTLATGANALTPITTLTDNLISGPDIAQQINNLFFSAFDSLGLLAIYAHNMSSGGGTWSNTSAKLSPPSQAFAFNPAVCAENSGHSFSVNVAAVTGHELWFATTPRMPSNLEFSAWMRLGTNAASSPDCVITRDTPDVDASIHVLILSGSGGVIDVNGDGMSWVTTDLGLPP